jgi:vacuolar-type H+-ATPase subunit C/Vma6
LLPQTTLERLARAPDIRSLASVLAEAGIAPIGSEPPTPAELEASARREVSRRLRVLARWLGPRATVLAVVFDDEDRRSMRALIRGATAGAPAHDRLAGLVPTPTLPERALEDLAQRSSPREIATLLALWVHPFGAALLAATDPEHPDLVRIELAMHQCFAQRARKNARRGGAVLRTFVEETVDLLNAEAALLLTDNEHEIPVDQTFLEGGRVLKRETFVAATKAGGVPQAARRLATDFVGTGFDTAIRRAGRHPETLERAVLIRRLHLWHSRARTLPLSAAPVLHYLLRLRVQSIQVREVIWANVLRVPVTNRLARLVEA